MTETLLRGDYGFSQPGQRSGLQRGCGSLCTARAAEDAPRSQLVSGGSCRARGTGANWRLPTVWAQARAAGARPAARPGTREQLLARGRAENWGPRQPTPRQLDPPRLCCLARPLGACCRTRNYKHGDTVTATGGGNNPLLLPRQPTCPCKHLRATAVRAAPRSSCQAD